MSTERKILIVEDEMIIALMIEQMVERLGHTVIDKVSTGEEAVEAALSYSPDLILMDIRLQGEMDGIEAMSKIRKKKKIPVIYITGNTDDVSIGRIQQTGYIDCLTKPVSYNDLNRSVNFAS